MDETEDRSNSICSSEECFDKLEKLKHIRYCIIPVQGTEETMLVVCKPLCWLADFTILDGSLG